MRFRVSSGDDACELDLAIDYRALPPIDTRYGPALDVRELGANKVLAIFDRAEPRDFIDLAQLTRRFPLTDLVALAKEKDPGLDVAILGAFMARVRTLSRDAFELDDTSYQQLLGTVDGWRVSLHESLDRARGIEPDGGELGLR